VADVLGRGPVATEVPALDQQVCGDDDAPVRRADDRRVVAGADDGVRTGLEIRGDPGDEPELAGVENGDRCSSGIGLTGLMMPCATFIPVRRRVRQEAYRWPSARTS
jgi:hypothetical protein